MRVLDNEVSKFFENPFHDARFLLRKIDSKNAVVVKLRRSDEKPFEILRCNRMSCWSFSERSLKHVFMENDTLVGFAGFEEVRIEEDAEQVVAFAKPSVEAFIVIVRGSDRLNLLKTFYEVLWSECDFSTKIPKSLLMKGSFDETLDRRSAFLLLSSNEENEVKRYLEKGVRVALKLESEGELQRFYNVGVRCFLLNDYNDEYRERYADCFFILQKANVASALGRVDGLIVDVKEFSLEEIVLASLVNRLLPLYVSVERLDPNLLDVLGFGAFGWRRRTNPIFTRVKQESERIYEISFVNDFNLPGNVKIDVSNGSVTWFLDRNKVGLRKQTVGREDGRYFHFYREGVS
ncbi:hypothetical protein [Pseudothermotoga sp.]